MNTNELEDKALLQEYQDFKAANPKWREPAPIECLNLIMRREFADQILSGEKKVEFRATSKHYFDRLMDKETLRYIAQHRGDDQVLRFCDPVRIVKKLRFHNYNETWHLECECLANDTVSMFPPDVEFLQKEFACHELDEELEQYEASGVEFRPSYFYFVIGKILGTNLPKPKNKTSNS